MKGLSRFQVVLGLSLLASAAFAAPPQSTVFFRDLDLQKSADVETLNLRIERAARRVCVALDGWSLRERAAFNQCVIVAIDDAKQSIAAQAPELHRLLLVSSAASRSSERFAGDR